MNALNILQGEFRDATTNMKMRSELVDKKNLIWGIRIDDQEFTISEEEVKEQQIVTELDKNNNWVQTGAKRDVKEALQNIIIDKLKSF